ncbi:hypothetical protein CRYUN_Cryun23aG0153000 [Craigia yunnanensis]
MDLKQAGWSLDSLISSFNTRIAELQELKSACQLNIMPLFPLYPASSVTDLSAIDAALKGMELQVQAIKDRLREETETIPKAKKLIAASLRQQKKLQSMSVYAPSYLPERTTLIWDADTGLISEASKQQQRQQSNLGSPKLEEPAALPKEKKGSGSPPLWYITAGTGFFVLKISGREPWLPYAGRDIATTEAIKRKHFFLETDMKGPSLKLDNTGKAILTVLRHLCCISETRIGHHHVIILLKPQ